MLSLQKQKEISRLRREVDEIKSVNQQKREEVARLKLQISTNGPEIKRRKFKEEREIDDIILRDQQNSKIQKAVEDRRYESVRELERAVLDADPRDIERMTQEAQERQRKMD